MKHWERSVLNGELDQTITLRGTVSSTGSKQSGPYLIKTSSAYTRTESSPLPAASGMMVELITPFPYRTKLQYGDIIEVSGSLQHIPPPRNPHEFNRKEWMYRQGAVLSMIPHAPITIDGVSSIYRPVRTLTSWRQSIRQSMTSGLDPESQASQLICAVVLGERPPNTSSMVEDFRKSGTLHVFAVSGLHVGMVGTICACLLWFVRAPRWVLISCIILSMAAYSGITGLRPPSVRAVIMASVFLTGFLIKRKPSLINSLAMSAIIVCIWDGHQLFTPGFQLSYGVLLALALATTLWIRILKPMAEIDPFMPRLLLNSWQQRLLAFKGWLRNSLAVSLAAWMGSAPLIWIHFGIITPIAIIAGIPLMLMVFMVLALAMLGVSAGAIWKPAGDALNHINALVAASTYQTAALFADIPAGHHYRRPTRAERGRIIVFDLPNGGGANLIDAGGGILLDSGRSDTFLRHVLPSLRALRIQPDSLIISHADAKHSGGMITCLDFFSPEQAMIPRADLLSRSYQKFLEKSAESGCRMIIPRTGQTFPIEEGVALEVIHAPADLTGYGRADDSGLILRLHWHGWKVMFTGDAGFITESSLLTSGRNLNADVLISGRNRDDFTGHEDFYRAVSPRVIITSNSDFPVHESVPQNWFSLTHSLGITVMDQKKSGAVTLSIEDENLKLTPTLDKAKVITLEPEDQL